MDSKQRHRRILAILEEQSPVKVNELAVSLEVSKETIRRDLTHLAERELLRKVHGAALSIRKGVENDFAKRRTAQLAEKRRIAEVAAKLFRPGDTICIDTGTTTALFCAELAKHGGLIIFTNSYENALTLSKSGKNAVYLLGGKFEGETSQTYGPLLNEQLQSISVDYAVLTIGTVDAEQEFMHYNVEEASVAIAMKRRATSTIVLADNTKFGRKALFQVIRFKDVDKLITDKRPSRKICEALLHAGVEVVTAQEPAPK